MGLNLVPLFINSLTVFLPPISAEFGWGASVFPRALVVAALTSALFGPLAGRLIDRHGVRPFLLAGLVLFALCLLALSVAPGNGLMLYAIPAVMGIAGAFCGPISFTKVISGWFPNSSGLALGLVTGAAPGIASGLMVGLASLVIDDFGWRTAYFLFGALVLLLSVPIAFLFVREAPEAAASANSGDVAEDADAKVAPNGLSIGDALRTRTFWLIVVMTCLTVGASSGIAGQFLAWSSERGGQQGPALAAVSFFYFIGPAGPALAGLVADRFPTPRQLSVFYALPLLGLAIVLLLPPDYAFAGMGLMGMSFSASIGLLPFLTTRYFGLRSASEIFGTAIGLMALSIGAGSALVGLAHDMAGSYQAAVNWLFAAFAAAAIIPFFLRAYPFGAPKAGSQEPRESQLPKGLEGQRTE